MPGTIEELPLDILKLIIKSLSVPNRARFSEVCVRFNELIKPKFDAEGKLKLHEKMLEAICMPDNIHKIEKLLLKGASTQSNARINIHYRSTLILHVAALANNLEAIEVFLKRGDIHVDQKEDSYTALHWAAFAGNAEAAKLLIDRGADIYLKTEHGETPEDIASFQGHTKLSSVIYCSALGDRLKYAWWEDVIETPAVIRSNVKNLKGHIPTKASTSVDYKIRL